MPDRPQYRNKVAIVGFGITPSRRHADVPIAALAVETADQAIKDAGLTRADIDGVGTAASLPAYGSERALLPGYGFIDAEFLCEHMALDVEWSYDDRSFPPAVVRAAQAVASGAAKYVLLNRTLHNPAGRYNSFNSNLASGSSQWTAPYGYVVGTTGIAMPYMEYQMRYGMTREHMAALVLQLRANVQSIPEAYWYGKPLTVDDYMNSRMISEPMCLYDNDIPVDGGGSFIVTTAERAADLPHRPVYITDWAQVRHPYRPVPGTLGSLDEMYAPTVEMAQRLWSRSGLVPSDIHIPQLYDGFSPLVLWWLECLGFCEIGEAWQMVQDGGIDPSGRFPLLSGGGNLGWGRVHGVPHILENYLQLSGRAGDRQIERATTGISTYSVPGSTQASAILYTNDRTV